MSSSFDELISVDPAKHQQHSPPENRLGALANETENFDLLMDALELTTADTDTNTNNMNATANIVNHNLTPSYDLASATQINYANISTQISNPTTNITSNKHSSFSAVDLNKSELHAARNTSSISRGETIDLNVLNTNAPVELIRVADTSKSVLFTFFRRLVYFLVGIPVKNAAYTCQELDNECRSMSNVNKKKTLADFMRNRSLVAFFFFGVTLLLGVIYAFFNIWFAITNGSSGATKNSILIEFTSISMALIWFLLGILFKKHISMNFLSSITNFMNQKMGTDVLASSRFLR